jgi:hypothetical protein
MRFLLGAIKALAAFIVLTFLGAVAAAVYITTRAPGGAFGEGTAIELGAVAVSLPYPFVFALAVSAIVLYRSLAPHVRGPQ